MLKIWRKVGIPELNGVLERRSVTECDGGAERDGVMSECDGLGLNLCVVPSL